MSKNNTPIQQLLNTWGHKLNFDDNETEYWLNLEREAMGEIRSLNQNVTDHKIILLNTFRGIYKIKISDIHYCHANRSSSFVYLSNNEKIEISEPIGKYENRLIDFGFMRVHKSYIVNLNYVIEFMYNSRMIKLSNKSLIPVSIRKITLLKGALLLNNFDFNVSHKYNKK